MEDVEEENIIYLYMCSPYSNVIKASGLRV